MERWRRRLLLQLLLELDVDSQGFLQSSYGRARGFPHR